MTPITGLDIGTTQVCAMIGERNEDGELEILGVGLTPSSGLRKGVVVNIEATQQDSAQGHRTGRTNGRPESGNGHRRHCRYPY